MLLRQTRIPAVARVGRPYRPYPKSSVRLRVTKRKQFHSVTADLYTLWWRCYIKRNN